MQYLLRELFISRHWLVHSRLVWLLLRCRGESPIGWDVVPAKIELCPPLSSLLSSLSHRRAVLSYSLASFSPSPQHNTTPLSCGNILTPCFRSTRGNTALTYVTDNINYAINELRQLRHRWEGGRHQSQGMQVMYARQILQSYVPTESLAKAQKTVQTTCCRVTWWGSLLGCIFLFQEYHF